MRLLRSIVAGPLLAMCWAGAAHATPTDPLTVPPTTLAPAAPPEGDPAATEPVTEQPPPIVDTNVVSGPLVVVPAGCGAPPAPVAVFVGVISAQDATTARFAIQQIRAGTLDGYAVGTTVDVRYDDDIRFLRSGQQYLVGAAPDPLTGVLHSKVRLQPPLFGGDAVIDVNDTDVACPRVEDGVKTLNVDGSEVDTGVLAPLKTAKRSLLRAVLKPLVIAIGVLLCITAIKLLVFAMVRAVRQSGLDDPGRQPDLQPERELDQESDQWGVGVSLEQR